MDWADLRIFCIRALARMPVRLGSHQGVWSPSISENIKGNTRDRPFAMGPVAIRVASCVRLGDFQRLVLVFTGLWACGSVSITIHAHAGRMAPSRSSRHLFGHLLKSPITKQ